MKHGEQLAPLIEQAMRQAGIGAAGPHRDRRRGRARAVHGAAGRAGDRADAGVRARDPGVRRVLARRARRSRRSSTGAVTEEFVVATDARRKEVYLASYDASGRAPRRPGGRQAGRARDRAAGGGGGRGALPRGLPDARSDRSGPRPAGWRAPSPSERVELHRPRAVVPAPPGRRRTRAPGSPCRDGPAGHGRTTCRPSPRSRPQPRAWTPGRSAWSSRASSARCRRSATWWPRSTARWWGTPWRASSPTSPSCSGSRSTRTTGGTGWPRRCSTPCWTRPAAEGADRLLLEVRENNAGAIGFYAAHGFVEIDRRPRYYRDGATAVVMRRALGRGCGGSVSS